MNFFFNLLKNLTGGDAKNKYAYLASILNIFGFFLVNSDSDSKGLDDIFGRGFLKFSDVLTGFANGSIGAVVAACDAGIAFFQGLKQYAIENQGDFTVQEPVRPPTKFPPISDFRPTQPEFKSDIQFADEENEQKEKDADDDSLLENLGELGVNVGGKILNNLFKDKKD